MVCSTTIIQRATNGEGRRKQDHFQFLFPPLCQPGPKNRHTGQVQWDWDKKLAQPLNSSRERGFSVKSGRSSLPPGQTCCGWFNAPSGISLPFPTWWVKSFTWAAMSFLHDSNSKSFLKHSCGKYLSCWYNKICSSALHSIIYYMTE